MAPMTVNTVRNPIETARLTAMARATLAEGLDHITGARSIPKCSTPKKNDRYAGSIANPHGFTVASMPVVKA